MVRLKKGFPPASGACFTLFLAAGAALSYAHAAPTTKGWIFVAGLLIPLLFLAWAGTFSGGKDPFAWEFLPTVPPWLWVLLAATALFLRFYRLEGLYFWPTGDEGLHGFLALHLVRHWDWRFFYTVGEHPPLLIWMLALFLKVFHSTLFGLWFLPAFFSAAAVAAGYFAGRRFFSRSLSFLFTVLMAVSFWPLYSGRFCHQGLFIPFWELSSFWLLSYWVEKSSLPTGKYWALASGLWAGLGAWTFTSWFTVLFLLLATVLYRVLRRALKGWVWFLAGLGLALAPFLAAALREGYGHHLLDVSSLGPGLGPGHRLFTHLSYLTSLFWGPLLPDISYGPVWGGLLNPVLASAFFLGAAVLYRRRKEGFPRWIAFALAVCLAPALLAGDYVEMNRIIQVMPLLLLVACIGLEELLGSLGSPDAGKKWLLLSCLLFLSFGLDLNHFLKPAGRDALGRPRFKNETVRENMAAYRVLDDVRSQRGPGLLFVDFLPLRFSHALYVAAYPFNGAVNPRIDARSANWAGLVTEEGYAPFLAKRFPDSRWYGTGKGPEAGEGGLAVGVIPLTVENRGLFGRWLKVRAYFDRLNRQAEQSFNSGEDYRASLAELPAGRDLVRGDPFLESVYWEWCSQYFYSPSYARNIRDIRNAVHRGYPAAHLYRKLAALLLMEGRRPEAEKALREMEKVEKKYVLPEVGRTGG